LHKIKSIYNYIKNAFITQLGDELAAIAMKDIDKFYKPLFDFVSRKLNVYELDEDYMPVKAGDSKGKLYYVGRRDLAEILQIKFDQQISKTLDCTGLKTMEIIPPPVEPVVLNPEDAQFSL
jgi:hypothetical protein